MASIERETTIAATAVAAALALAAAGLGGCNRDHPGSPSLPQVPPDEVASRGNRRPALDLDAASLEPQVDPPGVPGDLKGDIDAFTTVDACVQGRQALDPLVRDAIEAIGYDTLLRDACRVIAAAKAADPKACAAIEASALRDACVATVAEVTGRPDACPWALAGRPERGREPACVAVASRDPRLCAGVARRAPQAACVAMASHDSAGCAKLEHRADRDRCARSAKRWASVFPAPAASPPFEATGRLHIETDAGAGAPVDVDFTSDVREGAVLRESLTGTRIELGALSPAGPSHVGLAARDYGSFAVELFVPRAAAPAGGNGAGAPPVTVTKVERAEALLPGRAPLVAQAPRALAATWTKLDRSRGAALEVDIAGPFEDASGSFTLHAHVQTFVRDVVMPGADARGPADR
jgi:hypothetical protein